MRLFLAIVTACVCAIALLSVQAEDVAAGPPVSNTHSMSYTCPPFNLYNPDAGDGVNGVPVCGDGQQAVKFENETANAVHFCGKTGCTRANATSVGFKRSTAASAGNSYEIQGNRYTARCISGTADAGVVVAVQCAKY